MTELYGVALLPEIETANKIIEFQNDNLDFFKEPKLSPSGFLPHVSVLQSPFHVEQLTDEMLKTLADEWKSYLNKELKFGKLYQQPVGWYFLGINCPIWLRDFQLHCLSKLISAINREKLGKNAHFEKYSPLEQTNFLNFGYRYIGEAFRPHITLGRNLQGATIPIKIQEQARKLFTGKSVKFDTLAFYQAGPNGALDEILDEVKL